MVFDKLRGKDDDYWQLLIYSALFLIVASLFKFSPADQLQMTNTFATISGVPLGLYSVIQKPLQWRLVRTLLISILVSLMSSMLTAGTPWVTIGPPNATIDQIANSVIFDLSALFFAFTTFSFGMSVTLRKSS